MSPTSYLRRPPADVVALGLSAAWLLVAFWPPFARQPLVVFAAVTPLFVVSILALRELRRSGRTLGVAATVACTFALVLLMFTIWGTAIGIIPVPRVALTWPQPFRISTVLLPSLFVTVLVVAVFSYPLAVLLPRAFWIVPCLSAALVASLQYRQLLTPSTRPLVLAVMLFEWVCLLLLVPLLLRFCISKLGPLRK